MEHQCFAIWAHVPLFDGDLFDLEILFAGDLAF